MGLASRETVSYHAQEKGSQLDPPQPPRGRRHMHYNVHATHTVTPVCTVRGISLTPKLWREMFHKQPHPAIPPALPGLRTTTFISLHFAVTTWKLGSAVSCIR